MIYPNIHPDTHLFVHKQKNNYTNKPLKMILGSEIMCVIKYTTPELHWVEVWLMFKSINHLYNLNPISW